VTNALFVTENGPDCCDEVNRVVPGGNYGWPWILGKISSEEFIDPVIEFTSTVVPTPAIFSTGKRAPFLNDLLFGDYAYGNLHRVALGGEDRWEVLQHEVVYSAPGPIIGVFQDVKGRLYISTPSELYRITYVEGDPS
jgi:quinoprotein glucose dehydrogenase